MIHPKEILNAMIRCSIKFEKGGLSLNDLLKIRNKYEKLLAEWYETPKHRRCDFLNEEQI